MRNSDIIPVCRAEGQTLTLIFYTSLNPKQTAFFECSAPSKNRCTSTSQNKRRSTWSPNTVHSESGTSARPKSCKYGPGLTCSINVRTLSGWQRWYSYSDQSYRTLRRTLMNLPGGIPPELLFQLSNVELERPITDRVELLGILRCQQRVGFGVKSRRTLASGF
jgi:hypothetical protein